MTDQPALLAKVLTVSDGVANGTVFLGLSIAGASEAIEVKLPGDRERVRWYGTISASDLLRRRLSATLRS